jgi:hypothetical protein
VFLEGHLQRPRSSASASLTCSLPRPGLGLSASTETLHAKKERDRRDPLDEHADDAPTTFDPLDPSARQAAQLAPISFVTAAPPVLPHEAEIAPRARVSMEDLLPQLVKRIAWAGDRRRGSVQLELGAGRHAGTIVTVHAADGRVRVELEGGSADELRSRIRSRLERQGLTVESVT